MSALSLVLNLLWIIFGGLWMAFGWVIAGIVAWGLVQSVRSLDPAFLHWSDGGRYVAGGAIRGA